jgi:hypothetical protein
VVRLLLSVAIGVLASSASYAQRRPLGSHPPSSRTPSSLSVADSVSLVRAAARQLLAPTDAARRCVRGATTAVGGEVGRAFAEETARLLAARPAAASTAHSDRLMLLRLRDGDTATVVVRHVGARAQPSPGFWDNTIEYYFVRDTARSAWHAVAAQLVAARDFVVDAAEGMSEVCPTRSRR